MNNIELRLPLEHIYLNQPFGVSYVNFYTSLGLLGHNGIDLRAFDNCKTYATHDGEIISCGTDSTGGIDVTIWNKENCFKTVHYHLKSFIVKKGQKVKAGELIGFCDNTGKYTTGSHLHFGLKLTDNNGNTLNYNNGYNGAIDPAPYFKFAFDGTSIGNKDWDKSRCYHRYYRGRPKGGYQNELRILSILGKKKIWPTAERINALVYGAWPIESIQNPAMTNIPED